MRIWIIIIGDLESSTYSCHPNKGQVLSNTVTLTWQLCTSMSRTTMLDHPLIMVSSPSTTSNLKLRPKAVRLAEVVGAYGQILNNLPNVELLATRYDQFAFLSYFPEVFFASGFSDASVDIDDIISPWSSLETLTPPDDLPWNGIDSTPTRIAWPLSEVTKMSSDS